MWVLKRVIVLQKHVTSGEECVEDHLLQAVPQPDRGGVPRQGECRQTAEAARLHQPG